MVGVNWTFVQVGRLTLKLVGVSAPTPVTAMCAAWCTDSAGAGSVGCLGRSWRRGHRVEGAHFAIQPRPALAVLAQAETELTLEVVVTGGSAERVRWRDWGEAVMLELRQTHPRTGADVAIRQAVRVPRDLPFAVETGGRLKLVCWGVMPSGILRHPVLGPGAV